MFRILNTNENFDPSHSLELGAGNGGLTKVFLNCFKNKVKDLMLIDMN